MQARLEMICGISNKIDLLYKGGRIIANPAMSNEKE